MVSLVGLVEEQNHISATILTIDEYVRPVTESVAKKRGIQEEKIHHLFMIAPLLY